MKRTIEKILSGKSLTLQELNEFVEKYVEKKKGKPPTAKELQEIVLMIKRGMFDLRYAAEQFAQELNLTIAHIQDIQTKRIIKTDVYE